jgi:Sporulation and spore germination
MISRRMKVGIGLLAMIILVMALALLHLKQKAEMLAPPPIAQPVPPPPSGPAQQLTLYLANDGDGSLRAVTVNSALPSDAGERARLALQTLTARDQQPDSHHRLGTGAAVEDVFLLDENSAVVNLNAAFADTHPSGIQVEWLTIESMVMTLKAQLPQLTRVRFLVDGNSRETLAGHVAMAGWFDVAQVSEAAAQQSGGGGT